MISTPSKGLDQNGDSKFIDKYYGRMPMYLKRIPETINDGSGYIVECNPEYIELFNGFINGTIPADNISKELLREIEQLVDLAPYYNQVPMPDYDAFFECAKWSNLPSPGCPLFFTKDSTYGCAVFYTADHTPLIVEP